MWKIIAELINFFLSLCGLPEEEQPTNCSSEDVGPFPTSESPKRVVSIAVVVFSPRIGAQRLWEFMWWKNPYQLCALTQAQLEEFSGGKTRFELHVLWNVDDFPPFQGGDSYDTRSYLLALRNNDLAKRDRRGKLRTVDYQRVFEQADLLDGIANGDIDEVWLIGGPLFGLPESRWVTCALPPGCGTGRILLRGFSYRSGEESCTRVLNSL